VRVTFSPTPTRVRARLVLAVDTVWDVIVQGVGQDGPPPSIGVPASELVAVADGAGELELLLGDVHPPQPYPGIVYASTFSASTLFIYRVALA